MWLIWVCSLATECISRPRQGQGLKTELNAKAKDSVIKAKAKVLFQKAASRPRPILQGHIMDRAPGLRHLSILQRRWRDGRAPGPPLFSSWAGQRRHLAGRTVQHGPTTHLGLPGTDWEWERERTHYGVHEQKPTILLKITILTQYIRHVFSEDHVMSGRSIRPQCQWVLRNHPHAGGHCQNWAVDRCSRHVPQHSPQSAVVRRTSTSWYPVIPACLQPRNVAVRGLRSWRCVTRHNLTGIGPARSPAYTLKNITLWINNIKRCFSQGVGIACYADALSYLSYSVCHALQFNQNDTGWDHKISTVSSVKDSSNFNIKKT